MSAFGPVPSKRAERAGIEFVEGGGTGRGSPLVEVLASNSKLEPDLVAGEKSRYRCRGDLRGNDDKHRHYDLNRGYRFLTSGDSQWLRQARISRAF